MSVITREFINKDIEFTDVNVHSANISINYVQMSQRIDWYKNLIQLHGGSHGHNIVIGTPPTVDQTACVFACLELGISISVVDYGRKDNFEQYKFTDPKTELLMPIDFFIVNETDDTDKYDFFSKTCVTTIIISEFDNSDVALNKRNSEVFATKDTVAIKCTSSGTTNKPKVIFHTHEFLYQVVSRNSNIFDQVVGLAANLNHGSSVATYYLPAIHSTKVTQLVHFGSSSADLANALEIDTVNHLMIPYRSLLEQVSKSKYPNTTFYTLSSISKEMKKRYNELHFRDIISIFGCNETSGPTLTNRISYDNFAEDIYYQVDDFYKIRIIEGKLYVSLPVYGTTINTQDMFIKEGEKYIFAGRNDLQRINGTDVNLTEYKRIASETGNCDLIIDSARSAIYLAVWDNSTKVDKLVKRINKQFKTASNRDHYINKVKVLDKQEFLSGVKIDYELLRHYFRTHVREISQIS